MRKFPSTLLRISIAATAALGLSACSLSIGDDDDGEAPVAGETVTSGSFDEVKQAGPDKVVIVPGDTASWTVDADADTVEKMRISVDDGVLKIRRKNEMFGWVSSGDIATVRVTMPVLRRFTSAGSGAADIAEMTGDSGEIAIAGSGSVSVDKIDVSRLELDIAGSGKAALAGTAERMELSLAGSGDVSGKQLKVDRADVSVAGSGDVDFASDGEVEANIAGSGNVTVTGSAKCTSRAMGSGEISCNKPG
ncbi:MAG: head GIN domain-containing protein [Pseudomonadota bacterium]